MKQRCPFGVDPETSVSIALHFLKQFNVGDIALPSAGNDPWLMRALMQILRPIVRLAIAHGLHYPQFAELLKRIYVDVAKLGGPEAVKQDTDSRLSLVTGIHRKDIKRLRLLSLADDEPMPEAVSLSMRVLNAWLTPPFADRRGSPKVLTKLISQSELSFESLVNSVNRDIRHRAILDEWERIGLVMVDRDNRVHLLKEAFVPETSSKEKAFYFTQNLRAHAAAACENMLTADPPFLERSVHYRKLPASRVEAISEEAEREGMHLLKRLNRMAQTKLTETEDQSKKKFTFGIYFYQEDVSETVDKPHEPS
jgi:hypothetical protein